MQKRTVCECTDTACPAHLATEQCEREGAMILYRVDMEDVTGTVFCETCADDAIPSGLFDTDTLSEADHA